MCFLCTLSERLRGCVFFFFKQKTAYELRISDWSSDVCSSDLCCAGDLLAGEGRKVGLLLRVGAPLRQCDCNAAGCEDRKCKPHEIGRASCRERVCQYV